MREVLDDVHHAMRDGDIVKDEFAWIKVFAQFPTVGNWLVHWDKHH